jgi:hypothetical protein
MHKEHPKVRCTAKTEGGNRQRQIPEPGITIAILDKFVTKMQKKCMPMVAIVFKCRNLTENLLFFISNLFNSLKKCHFFT